MIDTYFEKVKMPDSKFKIDSRISTNMDHVIAVHPHWHYEVEILYFMNGYAKQQVNEHFFIAEPGDIVIIGKDQLHSTYSYQDSKCDILILMFDVASLFDQNTTNEYHEAPFADSNLLVYNNPIKSEDQSGKQILECMMEIHKELDKKDIAYCNYVKSLLYKMAGICIRQQLFEKGKLELKDMQIARRVLKNTIKLIDESYFEDITLKKAASASSLSIPHFCRLFKKTTGMTFNDYLAFYRINRAERMLKLDKTITEVAFECGFGSISSFIRNFRKFKDCTPSSCKKG